MHLEFRHLRTIKAIYEEGGLARAADRLNITQSALSHQVKGLEAQAGVELFVRRSKPLKLSPAGMRLLALAEDVLPKVETLEDEFRGIEAGTSGRLHIAMECHACFDWLFPVLHQFREAWPDVDIDIRQRLAFGALPALEREEVDFVISSDPDKINGVTFVPLFNYAPMCAMSSKSPLTQKAYVEAEDFRDQTLITYPMERTRLDVFKDLLIPAGIEPAQQRKVELTDVILMLVAAGRGVAVLPNWVMRDIRNLPDYAVRPLTANGVTRTMYAAVRDADLDKPYMTHVLKIAKSEAVKLQRG
ncbi:LysR family transcriptional regulator [Celeribacter halophilus]|uniref:HTH-type transcriptional regulator MetR n=1 Tax=Celeribacter halophilus TaxID=576117 RepID=A0A1I3MRT2_9RHOB|nr:LysR family transcriptional regulator [Celeribacter halophilus]PZX15492.1 LysR family transcriptional regulator for metE and metH [Celeribacter halophilus]SFI99687.1 LysR family transcriptional regulator, regulator for metE and metH [Celeribacter halophilus]